MTPHRFDPLSFVAGAILVASALVVLFGDTAALLGGRWLAPIVAIAVGSALVGWVWSRRPDARPDRRPDARPDLRPDARPDAHDDPRPDAGPDPRDAHQDTGPDPFDGAA